MPTRFAFPVSVVAAGLMACGCAGPGRGQLAERAGGSAALFGQFRAYDGRSGRPLRFADVVQRCRGADVVLFGEEHNDVVCNELEAQLLSVLAAQPRPVALAMEFFESDTQAALDAYLARRIDEAAFREQARQGRAYVLSHRPLIELCRAGDIPVLAANAPRRLVRSFRTSDLAYAEFRQSLPPADQRWLPVRSAYLSGPYEKRFFEMMSAHEGAAEPAPAGPPGMPPMPPPGMPPMPPPTAESAPATPAGMPPMPSPGMPPMPPPEPGEPSMPLMPPPQAATQPAEAAPPTDAQPTESTPAGSQPAEPPASAPAPAREMGSPLNIERFFRSQLLWDDAMAESLANYRARHPADRVMLIVGGFHVAHRGGTAIKFHQRRPRDRICTVVFRGTPDDKLAFGDEDRGAGDVVIYGIVPPPEKERPATQPASQPAAPSPGAG